MIRAIHSINFSALRTFAQRLCLLFAIAVVAFPDTVHACSVCFGDPDNPMTKGAVAGVYVMVGFIGFVLVGVAGTATFWMVRSRRLSLPIPPDQTLS